MEFKEIVRRIEEFGAKFPKAQCIHASVSLHEGGPYGSKYDLLLPIGLKAQETDPNTGKEYSSREPLIPPDSASAGAEDQEAPKGKKSRARSAAATAPTTGTDPAKSATEADLFGSASEATTPAKSPMVSIISTATQSASPSDDDLFGEKAAPAKDAPKATIEQLRNALTQCQTKHGHKDHALGVLKKFTRDGNPTISTLDEAKYQAVIDACTAYVPAK